MATLPRFWPAFMCLAGLALAGCSVRANDDPVAQVYASATEQPARTPPPMPSSATLSDADVATCRASGGWVARRGLMGDEMCIHLYADGGRKCTDSSQCSGDCLANEDDAAKGGTCQPDDRRFGCQREMKRGVAQPRLCID